MGLPLLYCNLHSIYVRMVLLYYIACSALPITVELGLCGLIAVITSLACCAYAYKHNEC